MTRLVLLSDASKEFPTDSSSRFTVRLSEPLQFKEEGVWEVGLLSLSMPGAGLRLDEFTSSESDDLVWVSYLVDDAVRKDAPSTVNGLTQTFPLPMELG